MNQHFLVPANTIGMEREQLLRPRRGVEQGGGAVHMAVRRTIGISLMLALLATSASAIAKTGQKSAFHHSGEPLGGKTGKAEMRTCTRVVHTRAPAHASVRHVLRVRHRHAVAHFAARARGGSSDLYSGPVRPVGGSQIGAAVWYNRVGAMTSTGERLDTVTATAAHRSLPLASYAKVTNLDNGRAVIVKINDRGPWTSRFIIDLSPRAADVLEMRHAGVAAVVVEPVAFGPDNAAPTVATLEDSGARVAQ